MFLRIKKPDDWHLHLRDEAILQDVVLSSARNFCRVVVMPNLFPPIDSVKKALNYRERIFQAIQQSLAQEKIKATARQYEILEREVGDFDPQMTLFLNENISVSEIDLVAATKNILGLKLYPSNATTNSQGGVENIESFYPIFERMQEKGVPLLIHGESGAQVVDVFERENRFIDEHLTPILQRFPQLKITLEHISTAKAVDFIAEKSEKHPIAATITVHHLLLDRNDLLAEGLKPHYYCKPLVKTFADKKALIRAATSGKSCFFLGTDSAPHAVSAKENCCGAAGIFSAPYALVLLASLFEKENALLGETSGAGENVGEKNADAGEKNASAGEKNASAGLGTGEKAGKSAKSAGENVGENAESAGGGENIGAGEKSAENGILESFCSVYGAQHYGFPVTKKHIILEKVEEPHLKDEMHASCSKEKNSLQYRPLGDEQIVVFSAFAGNIWRVAEQ